VFRRRHDNVHDAKFAPSLGKVVTANGICRVQLTNATVDRLATVACSAGAGEPLTSLHCLQFGSWLVAMNSDLYRAKTWTVPLKYAGRRAREMVVGGEDVTLPRSQVLLANQTVVFYVAE
jgi:hypothetical protein